LPGPAGGIGGTASFNVAGKSRAPSPPKVRAEGEHALATQLEHLGAGHCLKPLSQSASKGASCGQLPSGIKPPHHRLPVRRLALPYMGSAHRGGG